MFRFDDEMGERPGDGIDDHPSQVPADTVAATDFAADAELRGFAHAGFLSSKLF
jgi:hypothetical protein